MQVPVIKFLTFIRPDHVTYVIEAGVSLDNDFLSGHLAAVLSFLVLRCTFLFVLNVVNTEASCVGMGFICASAHTVGFVLGPDDGTKTADKKIQMLCFVPQCDLAESNIKGEGDGQSSPEL